MIKTNSIYTLNKKDPNAIVYPTADGKLIRVFFVFVVFNFYTTYRKKITTCANGIYKF